MSSSSFVVYRARRILTMNPARPEATHVAVRDGRILGAGSLGELEGWGEHTLDERFADKVLMPGLVEGHSHATEGSYWRYRMSVVSTAPIRRAGCGPASGRSTR